MIGAKDVAFPRLTLQRWYCYIFGGIMAALAIIMGGIDTGWTFYTPYSTDTTSAMGGVIPALIGVFILGFSSIFTGLNFVTTIHRLRPPGMTWFRMPLFLWSIYATAIIQVLATPVLGITLALLIVERAFGIGIFNPVLGGDPVLYQHFFWFYSHPAVYIMILPGMGIISELIAVHSHRHIFGYSFIAWSSIAIALLSFVVWGHHMFTSGQSALVNVVFSFITFSVSIPSAIKVFNWLATMYKGSISLNTPMLYALGFIFIFAIGGLTGIHLGTLATDVHLHDTYFVVAHFHMVMAVSPVLAVFGAVYHWYPKITGRMLDESLGKFHFWVTFVGLYCIYYPMHYLGILGVPRRYYSNGVTDFIPESAQTLNAGISIAAIIVASTQLVFLYNLAVSTTRGKPAGDNPWGATTLEWQTATTPPTHGNFGKELPLVYRWAYDYSVPGAKEDFIPQNVPASGDTGDAR